ncbi:MAG TPA: hypothetical protein VNI78_09670 [Vicinamibacterales bacterium]|nr:hypothetical protein [Vicinamibacterales bacterium]
MQLAEQLDDRLAVLRVEVARRLVGEQDRWLPAYGARDRHALLLAARELTGQVLGAMRHADPLERRHHPLLPLGRPHAAIRERQLDVLEDRQIANQVEALEDEADLAAPQPCALGERQVGRPAAVEEVEPLGRRVEQPDDRDCRRTS